MGATGDYRDFLRRKSQLGGEHGFEPVWLPEALFPFQRSLVEWAVRKGRAAIFADCGLGKTPMQLVWAENVVRHTSRPVLVLTPLAVSHQVVTEADKFGVEAHRSADGQPRPNITVTNYERLGRFDPADYSGVVCDEASIIKHWSGSTQKAVTRFLSKLPYRLLCTATPSPNDFVEMGTASEALGNLTRTDMLATFFRQLSDDEKKKRATADDIVHSRRLSWRVLQSFGQWVLKPHAFEPFWKWVACWARACRKPSDLGPFEDGDFVLPALNRRDHTIVPRTPPEGFLFTVPAFGLNQERAERRRTLSERAELVTELIKEHDRSIIWCHLNEEGDLLERSIPNALQIAGRHDMEYKEAVICWFLGYNCLCNDKRFSARIASWQRENLVTGSAIINSIVSSCLPNRRSVESATQKPEESTSASITTPTSRCGSVLPINKTGATPPEESATPTIPSAGKKSRRRSSGPGQKTQTPGSEGNCASTASPSKSIARPSPTDAPSVAASLPTGEGTDSTPTTAMKQEPSEAFSAGLVIVDSATSAIIQSVLNEPRCICGHQSGTRRLISKPKVCGLGLNLQHCAHVVTFVTHSYEQFYQCVRRCWRFGQKRPVTLDVIATEGEVNVRKNMDRKEQLAATMFDSIVRHMNDALAVQESRRTLPVEVPTWL